MITCYVVDDEYHAIEILCDIIENIPGLQLLGHTTNPLNALEFITTQVPPDLTFADINMPEMTGIEFAALVNDYTTVVFTTAYDHFAVEAFEKEAFDYLLKPVTRERFLKCLTKYRKGHKPNIQAKEEYFYIKGDIKGKMIRVITADIMYIEGALNYVIIHMADGKHEITYLTMGELQNQLSGHFLRVHRSFIVNSDKIKTVGGNSIVLDDKTVLSIGTVYKNDVFDSLNRRLIKTKRIL
ncbi:MAG TPA: LytTR family DNA-binding domain-containing protein [Mucilaginibacter sp.]|jgi:DNA-binding LytR/AlgR family response regulator|nr:LytTR family DNA-binding domain-containing protein [Mucilaginibacter sp.]